MSYEQFFKGREPALKQVTLQQVASMLGIQWRTIPEDQPGQPEGWGSPPRFPNKGAAEVEIMLPDMLAFLENAARLAGVHTSRPPALGGGEIKFDCRLEYMP